MKLRELNDDMSWFVIKAITKHALKNGKKFFGEIDDWGIDLGNDMDIKYSINGVELDFVECWKDYEKAWERGVKKKAKELITQKTWDVFDGIRDKASKLEEYLTEKIDELFPDLIDEDDEYE